ncbi:MAG: hypothetical protein SF052_17325 [Bacteroidia bacterium]|nr:hypothetical protein [Bacteroidia bacterium]
MYAKNPRHILLHSEFTYARPTLSLTDGFYFNTHTAPETLVMLLNRLSETFLNKAWFRMQLETTDGDFHLNLDPAELKFMYKYRRDTLFMLYMDAITSDGQWVNIRLSFHPLEQGPNGEAEITSHQAEDILQMIHDHIGIPPHEKIIPAALVQRFPFDPESFSVELLTDVFEEISRNYLHRIPPVAFLSVPGGVSYTGLSFYQLGKKFSLYEGRVAILSAGITKVVTGQTLSLMFEFCPHETQPVGTLNMIWGDTRKQDAVWQLIRRRMNL